MKSQARVVGQTGQEPFSTEQGKRVTSSIRVCGWAGRISAEGGGEVRKFCQSEVSKIQEDTLTKLERIRKSFVSTQRAVNRNQKAGRSG